MRRTGQGVNDVSDTNRDGPSGHQRDDPREDHDGCGLSLRDARQWRAGARRSLGLSSLRAGVLSRVRRSDDTQRRMRHVHGLRERGVRVSGTRQEWE